MSRRKRRPGAVTEPAASGPAEEHATAPREAQPRSSRSLALDLVILAVVFGAAVGIAELAGAASLGVAFGIGQVAFAIALVALLLRD